MHDDSLLCCYFLKSSKAILGARRVDTPGLQELWVLKFGQHYSRLGQKNYWSSIGRTYRPLPKYRLDSGPEVVASLTAGGVANDPRGEDRHKHCATRVICDDDLVHPAPERVVGGASWEKCPQDPRLKPSHLSARSRLMDRIAQLRKEP